MLAPAAPRGRRRPQREIPDRRGIEGRRPDCHPRDPEPPLKGAGREKTRTLRDDPKSRPPEPNSRDEASGPTNTRTLRNSPGDLPRGGNTLQVATDPKNTQTLSSGPNRQTQGSRGSLRRFPHPRGHIAP